MRVSLDAQRDVRLLSLFSDQPGFTATASVACDLEEERRIPVEEGPPLELPVE